MKFQRNVVVITGAARGIGAACVRAAAARGCAVVFNYAARDDAASALASEIEASGGTAVPHKMDLGDPGTPARLFEAADRVGRVVGLVNNAGVDGGAADFATLPLPDIEKIFRVNVLSAMDAAQHAIRRMARSAGGSGGAIVNVSSQAAVFGGNRLTAYAASKAALNTFTIGLARELAGDGVRVNAVSPGVVETDMHAGLAPERRAQLAANLPLGRPGRPEEVARSVEWLLFDAPDYVSGAILPIAGAR
ncbi:MAG TPA: SDR family oxidoreductase [Alphaproteobacteria bacterium]|nr:SDR family oxidoreductase [Alphaproteobacteria bacterium]